MEAMFKLCVLFCLCTSQVQTSRLGSVAASPVQTSRLGSVPASPVHTSRLGSVPAIPLHTSRLGSRASRAQLNDLCDYKDNVADCSNRNLRYIPVLHANTTTLIFINNTLGNLTDETFVNVTGPTCSLESLDIANNSIRHITKEAFRNLTLLKTLILDRNDIRPFILKDAFASLNNQHLKRLSLNNMSLENIYDDLFVNLNESNISHISMRMNDLRKFNMSVFRYLRNLTYVDVSRNFMYQLKLYTPLRIKTLNLDFNRLDVYRNKKNCSTMQSITRLFMVHNDIMYLYEDSFLCFPNIKYLDLSLNPIIGIRSYVFASLIHLSELWLNTICGLSYIDSSAFYNKNVKKIHFSMNNIHFTNDTLSPHMFNGCAKLETLDLSSNIMIKTSQEYFYTLFKPVIQTVIRLSLTDNILRIFPKVLQTFPNLKYLYLAANELTYFDRGFYPPKLVYLNLYDNDITSVNEYSFPTNFADTHIVVNLGHNPFDCTCELLWFLEVFTDGAFNETFQRSTEDYTCNSPSSKRDTNLTAFAETLTVQSCLLGSTASLIVLFASSFLLILIIVGTVLYHYKWHFRYFLYLLRRNRLSTQQEDVSETLYDAFIVYAVDDLDWILNEAIPALEENEHLQLCIHQRDFVLGTLLVDTIIKCLHASRKFIILLSNNFGRSDWCQFELGLIQKLIRSRGQNLLIVIKLNAIDQTNMTHSMFNLLTTHECIEWVEEPRGRELFWTQLVQVLTQEAALTEGRSRDNII